ncbi:hypothetical protein [Arthrobacter sp. I3]|uniref:hypothetical protein n=1 Tax=Arthrobacter sp. I3 TaxID=218158 RepID=UPI0004818817|nr:hypothetical protein [Arthrobacter sp. I3]
MGGDQPFTFGELAAAVGEAAGKPVTDQNLPAEDYAKILVGAGLPEGYAAILADSDLGIARGELLVTSGDLRTLIGRESISKGNILITAHDTDRADNDSVPASGPAR